MIKFSIVHVVSKHTTNSLPLTFITHQRVLFCRPPPPALIIPQRSRDRPLFLEHTFLPLTSPSSPPEPQEMKRAWHTAGSSCHFLKHSAWYVPAINENWGRLSVRLPHTTAYPEKGVLFWVMPT